MPIGLLIPQPLRAKLFSPADLEALAALGTLKINASTDHLENDAAIDFLADCDIAIGSWGTVHPGNKALMEACPKLRLWEHVAGSVKHMFGAHLHGRDLTIASCKDAIATDVAELVLGLFIIGRRHYLPLVKQQSSKDRAGTLFRSSIGIVGASSVGRQVIEHGKRMECQVSLYDPFVEQAQATAMGVTLFNDLTSMCEQVDCLSIHTPLLDSTRHIVDQKHLQALADHAIVINSSRGPCINQQALQNELQKNRLYAFLDVTEPEPLPENHILRHLDNCMISPHIAGPPSMRLGRQCLEDVQAFINGKQPRAVISESMLEHIG